ncbi:hypothetical protein [Halalkalibacter alkalisediminis]|uniref:Uncharacterized protein n=1 Tax=Halalkalibacter alkalisediminis TaxID=935616 RepID=A0ABV6NMR7_9BACI|nr:hypothetical protein [Halalkalibacter alkalisediminis]
MELYKWRRNEQILVNVLSLSVILVLLAVMYLNSIFNPVYFLIIFINGLHATFIWLDMSGRQWRLFKWLVELRTYEKQKWGSEWFEQKQSPFTSMIFSVCLFILIFLLQEESSSSTDLTFLHGLHGGL